MGQDVKWQIEGMFQPRFDPRERRAGQRAAAAAGRHARRARRRRRPRSSRTASIASSFAPGCRRTAISRCSTPTIPDWKVDVDGQPAPLMRANGLFRAVHLDPGDTP